jgi:predicted DNA-binding transcriptional regulator YafY
VEFSAEKAHLVSSREWHPTQVITRLSNERIQLAVNAPNLAPLVSWILEWGPHARILAPRELVERVKRELDEAAAQYRS